MEFIAQKIKEYKRDVLLITLLLLIFVFLCSLFFAHQSNPIIDVGSEAYIPFQMLKGKILYKDIFVILPPLSYQLNSFLFLIFGASINTLYFAGSINALIIILAIYFIARNLTSPLNSAAITFSSMGFGCFTFYIYSYLFPNSFGSVYALSSFLLSALFFIRYLNNSNPKFVVVSSFFISLSFFFKYEFIAFLPILVFSSIFYKPIPRKYILYCIIAGLSVPLFSFSLLFMQGVTLEKLFEIISFIKKFSGSESRIYFLTNVVGLYFSPNLLKISLTSFTKTALSLSTILVLLYLLFYILINFSSENKLLRIRKITLISVIFINIIFFRHLFMYSFFPSSFSWLPIFTSIIFIISVIIYLKNKTLKNELFCFTVLIALAGTCKSFFSLNLNCYGTFFLPLLLLVNIIFFIEYFPCFFKFVDRKIWGKAFLTLVIITTLLFASWKIQFIFDNLIYPIKSDRGTIYTSKTFAEPLNNAMDYINKNIPENKTFLVFPEDVTLNFLTGRDSNNRHFRTIPVEVEVWGEQNIIDNLKKDLPDYIFINNMDSKSQGYTYFCEDYAQNICRFVFENYEYQTEFGKEFQIKIYKKK